MVTIMAEEVVKRADTAVLGVGSIKAPEIMEWDLEGKSLEELEKKMEAQKCEQEKLIKKINDQWYKEEWEWKEVLKFDKNINMIYLKIKEMKKSL